MEDEEHHSINAIDDHYARVTPRSYQFKALMRKNLKLQVLSPLSDPYQDLSLTLPPVTDPSEMHSLLSNFRPVHLGAFCGDHASGVQFFGEGSTRRV